MTEQLFFDTDCISSFLWTDKGCLLADLFPGRIIIPEMVFSELSRVHKPQFVQRLGLLLDSGQARRMDIAFGTASFRLYRKFTANPEPGHAIIGNGEASALALAKEHDGIIASNNFRDIAPYIRELEIHYTTTGDILVEAYENGFINLAEAESIWKTMIEEDCWIGADTFSEYLDKPYRPLQYKLS